MKTRINCTSAMERLKAELSRQVEAYNESIFNDEIIEVRYNIAMRIVAIEKDLINQLTITTGNNYFANNPWQ